MNNGEIIIDLNKLKGNVNKLKNAYKGYDYLFANVKNNFFGMGINSIATLIHEGINYLYVSTLKEAIEIRKINHDIPILITFNVDDENIYDVINNNITLTISDVDYLKRINNIKIKDKIKFHILIDNGCNKRGIKSKKELQEILDIIKKNKYFLLEGIYTEIETYGLIDTEYYACLNIFYNLIKNIDNKDLIIHLNEPLMYHKKNKLINGIRFDISLLGIEEHIEDNFMTNMKIKNIDKKYQDLEFPNIDLDLIFAIKSKIISFSFAPKKTQVGKNYIVDQDIKLGIVPIGYKDGITHALKKVVINKKFYPIISDSIDYMTIEVDNDVKIDEDVYIIDNKTDIYKVIDLLKTNRFYLMSILNNNLERVYLNEEETKEVL